jgi:hypothetical protein
MAESTSSDAPETAEPTIDSMVHGAPLAQPSVLLAVGQVAAGGAAFGALSGFTLLATLVVVTPGAPIAGAIPAGILFGASFGAFCGAVLAPSLGFWLFRHVPLWRLYAYSTVGTVVGGLLAALVRSDAIIGAFAGLAAALALVRFQHRRSESVARA